MKPFDQAWILLKEMRQTELGEFPGFEDAAFSSYGPITHYHGTTSAPAAAINEQGLKPMVPYESKLNQEQIAARLRGKELENWYPKGVYASRDRGGGEEYSRWRGQDRNEAPKVFGIRGSDLDTERYQGIPYFPSAIPRERLVNLQ